jgi:hypothetical protein
VCVQMDGGVDGGRSREDGDGEGDGDVEMGGINGVGVDPGSRAGRVASCTTPQSDMSASRQPPTYRGIDHINEWHGSRQLRKPENEPEHAGFGEYMRLEMGKQRASKHQITSHSCIG